MFPGSCIFKFIYILIGHLLMCFLLEYHDGYHEWSRNCSPSETTEFTPVFSLVSVVRYLAFCVAFYRTVFINLASVLSVLRFTLILITSLLYSNYSKVVIWMGRVGILCPYNSFEKYFKMQIYVCRITQVIFFQFINLRVFS